MENRTEQLRAFLREDPSDTFVMFALAQELSKCGQMEDARDTYLQLREADPDYIGLYFHLGKVESALGLEQEAFQTFTEGIEVAKRKNDAHAQSELEGALVILRQMQD